MKMKNYSSFATMANKERIEMLNLASKQKFKVEIIDKEDKHGRSLGTLVVIKISLSAENHYLQNKN